MSEKAERVCAAILGAGFLLDLLLVMAMEGGHLTGAAAEIAVAGVIIIQVSTLVYIKTRAKGRE